MRKSCEISRRSIGPSSKALAISFLNVCGFSSISKLSTIITCGTIAGAIIPEIVKMFTSTESGFVKNFVPGALSAYDIPDLIGCVAPRRIVIVELKDQMKQIAARELVDEELKFPLAVYSQKNAANNITILPHDEDISSIADKCFIKK